MGIAGLCTRKTWAPDGCVQWAMGMPAKQALEKNKPVAPVNIARVALIFIVFIGTL
jgi:hypothetical protein